MVITTLLDMDSNFQNTYHYREFSSPPYLQGLYIIQRNYYLKGLLSILQLIGSLMLV